MSSLGCLVRPGRAALGRLAAALRPLGRLLLILATLSVLLVPPAGPAEAQRGRSDPTRVGANISVPAYPYPFQFGIDYNYRGNMGTQELSTLAQRVGSNTTLVGLPQRVLTQFSTNFFVTNGDMPDYQAKGITNLLAVLTRPDPTCSEVSNPLSGVSSFGDYNDPITEYYAVKSTELYKPIWVNNVQNGQVNTDNCWANYIYQTALTYKSYVKVWQIWNEPDFTFKNQNVGQWYARPPVGGFDNTTLELHHWTGGSIFSYIRALRVAYEVIKFVDPNAFIAVGGIGYDAYLDGLLRYTDNPTDGSVSAAYPVKGGAYFDAVSWHDYPMYDDYDILTQTFFTQKDTDGLAYSFALKQNNLRLILNKYGYNGAGYPRKIWVVTETGLASRQVPIVAGGAQNFPGGDVAQRNYILKVAITAQMNQNSQVHWYRLTDGAPDTDVNCTTVSGVSSGDCVFEHMGLYLDTLNANTTTAQLKPAAAAYKTYATFLFNQQYDAAQTTNLTLPAGVRGVVFRATNGIKTFAIWAKSNPNATLDQTENTSASNIPIPSTVGLVQRNWDFSSTGATATLNPSGGVVTIPSVSSTPTFFTEISVTSPGPAVPADALGNLKLIAPVRVVDTRTDPSVGGPIGFNLDGTTYAGGALAANTQRQFLLAGKTFAGFTFPSQVSGVQINVTVVQPAASGGFITAYPSDLPGPTGASTVNPSTATAHNFWTMRVPTLGTGAGSISLFTTNQANVIVDVVGFWSPGNASTLGNLKFVPPVRVVDTRPSNGTVVTTGFNADGTPIAAGQLQPNTPRRFLLAGKTFAGTAIPADVAGILTHVTVVQGAGSGGFVTVYPGDASRPNASTVNPSTATAFNSWATGVGQSGSGTAGTISVYSTNTLDVIVDVVGFWAPSNPATLGNLSLVNPVRVVDTRPSGGSVFTTGYNADGSAISPVPLTPGVPRLFLIDGQSFGSAAVPTTAKGVLLNVTSIQGAPSGGFLIVYPGDSASPPNASTVNPVTAIAASFWASGIPTGATAPGTIAAYSTNASDLAIDLVGFFQ